MLNELLNVSLSVRSYNCLMRAGVTDLAQLSNWTKEDLMRVRNLGQKHFTEILNACHDKGIYLKDEKKPQIIDKLQKDNDVLKTNNQSMCIAMPNMAKAERTEAIKEFAERLKRNHIAKDDKGKLHLLIEYDEFDNLVKEMTESKDISTIGKGGASDA